MATKKKKAVAIEIVAPIPEKKSRLKDTWKNASPLVKTLTGIFIFVSAGIALATQVWNCNTSAVKTSNDIKSIPFLQPEIDTLKVHVANLENVNFWKTIRQHKQDSINAFHDGMLDVFIKRILILESKK
jgi:hypothetical protein